MQRQSGPGANAIVQSQFVLHFYLPYIKVQTPGSAQHGQTVDMIKKLFLQGI